MTLPGFVFHLRCPACGLASPDYRMAPFTDVMRPEIFLPAWSRHHRCFAQVVCFLDSAQRVDLGEHAERLRAFAAQLSSATLTVAVPFGVEPADPAIVRVDPEPICPACSSPVEVVLWGASSRESVSDARGEAPHAIGLRQLGLSVRAINRLERAGIASLGSLCAHSARDLVALPGMTDDVIREIRERVAAGGQTLRPD